MIKFKSKELLEYLFILVFILITGIVIIVSKHIIIDIIAMIFLGIAALSLVKYDFKHPYTWFTSFFLLYSLSYPILLYLDEPIRYVSSYTKGTMVSQWLALSTFLLVISPKKYTMIDNNISFNSSSAKIEQKIYLFFALLSGLVIVFARGMDISRKSDFYETDTFASSIGPRAMYIVFILFVVIMIKEYIIENKLNKKYIFITFSLSFFTFFFTGERDVFLRAIVVTFYLYLILIHKKKNNIYLPIFGIALIYIPAIMRKFKYFGVTGEVHDTQSNFIIDILNSEFIAASRNLELIVNNTNSKGALGGYSILSALIRAINLPIIPFNSELSRFRPSQWFHSNILPHRGTGGLGFTLVGEGYINFGYFGVILVFVITGLIAKVLYSNSSNSVYHLATYILSIPLFIYSIRGGLASLLSPLVGQILLSIFIIILINKFMHRLKNVI